MTIINSKGNYINGAWLHEATQSFSSISPFTQRPLWHGHIASPHHIDLAYQAAQAGFSLWSKTSLQERLDIIQQYGHILKAEQDTLAMLLARETGKILWEAKTEIAAMIGKIDLSIKAYHDRTGEHITGSETQQTILRHRPHGIMVVFGPYNFPGHLPNGHIVPALIAGNSVIFKPSDLTPAFAEAMVTCWEKAGLPAGVLNLLQGQLETAVTLSQDPRLKGLLFTGSSQTGTLLHKQFGGQPHKMLALEMGGNNATILCDAKDSDAVAATLIQSAFITTGQRCTCTRRLILVGDATEHLQTLLSKTKSLQIGSWQQDPQPFFGPLISTEAANKFMRAQDQLEEYGATCLLRGTQDAENPAFVTPAIWDVSTCHTPVPDEEVFAPLLKIYRAETMDQALTLANDTEYGLSAGLISDNATLFDLFAQEIQAGIVNWNNPTTGASGSLPFGGVGSSGNFRPSAWYAADYCAFPMASVTSHSLALPETLPPGMTF